MNYKNFLYYITITFCALSGVTPFISSLKDLTLSGISHFVEICHRNSIPADFEKLEAALKSRVFGQHIVHDIVVNALRSHWDSRNQPPKALTLSFHGWPGGGKNFVSNIIVESLFKLGAKSRFVHKFNGRVDFPLSGKIEEYQKKLYEDIQYYARQCEKQLFIFDEVEKIPAGLLDVIKPMIDYNTDVKGVDYRHCIFIFLSNTGSTEITDRYLEIWHNTGRKRTELKITDFEKLITLGAFNEKGGFYFSDNIKSNLIDHYIPFLPMERQHVQSCILEEFKLRGVFKPADEHIDEVMSFIEWGPADAPLFSTTGCKRVSQKVGVIVAKHYQSTRNEL